MNNAAEGEELDTETLQAQIDLSMSFAQELVSSWMRPSHKKHFAFSSRKDVEKELDEHMKRPPRLGVGAPIPETAVFSKETAKLKNTLLSKGNNKRIFSSEDDAKKTKHHLSSDEEEESRAGAIKKKVKIDPFDTRGKKKRKKEVIRQTRPSIPSTSALERTSPQETPERQMAIDDTAPRRDFLDRSILVTSGPSPKSKKKNNDNPFKLPSNLNKGKATSSTEEHASGVLNTASSGLKAAGFPSALDMNKNQDIAALAAANAMSDTIDILEVQNRSIPASGVMASPKLPLMLAATQPARASSTTARAILNLNGPPPDAHSGDESAGSESNKQISTKKNKKKRRRKKNKQASTTTSANDMQSKQS